MPESVATGPRSVTGDLVFPTPSTDRMLEEGSVIWVDTGVTLDGYDSDVRATFGLSLGIKHMLSDRFGLRAEGRAFFVSVGSGGGVFCSGSCLFVFRASGLWQGDLSAGVTLGF